MDRLDAMALFVAAIDKGSLAAAARQSGRSAATASRAVALLEAFAGETLLLRSTRQLRLTDAGERHFERWRSVLAMLAGNGADDTAMEGGAIVLTAPELFGRLEVLPVIEDFLARHQAISARFLMLNRVVDLIGEGIDLAVRVAPLADSSLTAIRLGEVRRLVCASPAYIDEWGTPDRPQDLVGHSCIGVNAESDGEQWSFRLPGTNRARSVRVTTRLSLNSAGAALDAAMRGRGIIHPQSYQVAEYLAAGRLVRLLPGLAPPPAPVHLVFHPERARRGALRAFIDYAVPTLRARLAELNAIGEKG